MPTDDYIADLHGTSLIADINIGTQSVTFVLVDDFTKPNLSAQRIGGGAEYQGFAYLSDRFVGWSSYQGAQVWDRLQHRRVVLPDVNATSESETWAHGNALVWQVPVSPDQARNDKDHHLVSADTMDVIMATDKLPTIAP